MNILVITQLYPQPDDAGGYKVTHTVEYFCKEWIKEGHKIFVMHVPSKFPSIYYHAPSFIKRKLTKGTLIIIPSKESRKEIHYVSSNGIIVHRLPLLKMLPGKGYSKSKLKSVANRTISLLSNENFKPDLVIGHFANPSTELVAILSSHYHCKSSIVFHNDCNESNIKKYRILDNIKHVNAIGCRSQYEAKTLKPLLNRDLFVCCSGVPNDAIEKANKYCDKHNFENGIRYLYVGGLVSAKNVDSIIKAFALAKQEKDTLTIVGDGDLKKDMIKLANDLGVEDSVIFLGRVSRNEVLAKMKESHVFAMISKHETFGMVYVEAMLQGCLTIASYNGGFDGIIKDGENGFLCEQGNPEMLAEVFRKISSLSIKERNKIGQNAINVGLNYSERDVAIRYLNEVIRRNEGNENE